MSFELDRSTWKRVAFGDVIENVAVRVDDPAASGVERYVGLEHLDPGVMTVERWDRPDKVEAQKLRFQPGDVIFGRRRAYQKKVARADFEGICSAHALVLRARPGVMCPDFLPVFLSSDYFLDRAIAISVGSLSPTVNWRDLKIQEFMLPADLADQQRIADLLWSIEHHGRALSVRTAAVIEARQCFLGTSFASELGESVRIADLCSEVVGGIWGAPEGENEVDVLALGPRVYATGSNEIVTDGFPTRSVSRRQAESRLIQEGDIILERSGGSPTQAVGRVVIAGSGLGACIPTDFQRLLRPNRDIINPSYLFWRLQHDWSAGVTRDFSKKTTNITNLSVGAYLAREITVPALDKQAAHLSQVESFEVARRLGLGELGKLQAAKERLLVEIFGEAG